MSENRKFSKFIGKIKNFQEETHFLIYLGTGLYQIAGGMLFSLLVSFLVGIPIIMAYPYLNTTLLWIIKSIGWIYIIIGVLTIISIFFKKRNSNSLTLKIISIVSIFLSILLLPIGVVLAFCLFQELKSVNKKEQKVRTLQLPYFSLLFFAGIIHVLIGVLFMLIVPDFLEDQITMLYPYINPRIIRLLIIYGYLNLIPGFLLSICSFSAIKFGKIGSMNSQGIILKVIRIIILFSSLLLIISFPFGTFFGLIIFQEFYFLKKNNEKGIMNTNI